MYDHFIHLGAGECSPPIKGDNEYCGSMAEWSAYAKMFIIV